MLQRLLIANRGEIVVRVAGTARALGLDTVGVYTDADAGSPHARAADQAVRISSYLDIEAIVEAARKTGADCIHPGYGFLSENADLARAVVDAGFAWVGPPPDAIEAMGDKAAAKARMASVGVPVLPGAELPEDLEPDAVAERVGDDIGYPLLVKAVAGGGGRGLRRVESAERLAAEVATARSEALAAFGDGRLMLERLVEGARHVEIQVLADARGHVMNLGERDCTTQRRHQKILEESPSPPLEADPELRRRMCEAAVAAAMEVGYVGAGTVEMLLSPDGSFYFLEMNTRLQVEHPVTELRYGLDLVAWQLRVANGQSLPADLSQLTPRGHAIEARVYAEDPARGFAPSPGRVLRFAAPRETPGVVRVDHALEDGATIPPDYDPMLAKVIVHGRDRDDALHKLDRALGELVLFGPTANVAFLRDVIRHPTFARDGEGLDTGFIERGLSGWSAPEPAPGTLAAAAVLLSRRNGDHAAGDLWGWRSAAGTEGWPVRVLVDETTEPTEVYLTPLHRDGRDPRDVYRACIGEDEIEIDFVRRTSDDGGEDGGRVRVDGLEQDLRWAFAEDGSLWIRDGAATHVVRRPRRGAAAEAEDDPTRAVASMAGRVKEVRVTAGDAVEPGDCLVVLEAMKLETRVEARTAGAVEDVLVEAGEQVARGQVLVRLG